ncbi:unnamed protein product [Colias eurytheme]|nr:unnamed protein product [Colias eurytheme]
MEAWLLFVFTVFLPLYSCCACDDDIVCGDNEVAKQNPDDCVPDCCPVGDDAPCPDPCPQGPCQCSLMSRRAENGTCIPTRQCPPYPCGENEQYDPCPVCPEECSNASPDGERCRSIFKIGITVICKPKCRCIDFFWRDGNNNCVPYEQCFSA